MVGAVGPIESRIHQKLQKAFSPSTLTITNESHLHAHHAQAANVISPGESHFRVVLVSPLFMGCSRVNQHKMVYDILKEELSSGVIHALALTTSESSGE